MDISDHQARYALQAWRGLGNLKGGEEAGTGEFTGRHTSGSCLTAKDGESGIVAIKQHGHNFFLESVHSAISARCL
ncbi:MAG: hypothetical protein A2X57_10265 [Nitrospirae bacterium GWD2_57_8]|nr:MAG: hypothetical protein A2X57_10265 [Nitrospirae bacterium GWD2_57_8]